ncbi:MAG TPA: hypothetical protein VLH56_11320 [Dissulfurispiraceae bacterium]|nr:hypothetical protein [Dissulfurispiraceae bacterium]
MDVTILIRRKADGHIVPTTARSFGLLTNVHEWEIVQPEQQYTPPVLGKSVRAEQLEVQVSAIPAPVTIIEQSAAVETFNRVVAEEEKTHPEMKRTRRKRT